MQINYEKKNHIWTRESREKSHMLHKIFLCASFSQNKNEFGALVLISFQGSYPISGFPPLYFTRDQRTRIHKLTT
jgi:hypothetical protein